MLLLAGLTLQAQAQHDVMMQAFYWDVPVDAAAKNGFWWDTLAAKAPELAAAGITAIWVPPPSKGNFGIYDMGYGIYDHFDLGNYNQKGTVETRFGSRDELLKMVQTMHAYGIEVYADIVLNHIFGGPDNLEPNPAVKQYVFDEAIRDPDGDGHYDQFSPYPTNEIIWRIPDAEPGDYYIKIKGYWLPCSDPKGERGYDLYINWDGSPDQPNSPDNANWEYEPNDGNGQYNDFPGSGKHIWAHIDPCGDVDEYKITLTETHTIEIRLEARREVYNPFDFVPTDQRRGYYPFEIWHNGQNLAPTALQAWTYTGITYVTHTGPGEANWSWNYSHFHPVDDRDYLGWPGTDEVIPNTKFFGNDLNTFDPVVQDRLITWGQWLTNTVGFDGYRLDFVRGYQPEFAAAWINNMPRRSDGSQRFVVAEYWGGKAAIKNWVTTVESLGADADAFDFPLKATLTDMANWNGADWDMSWLNHAGLVRDNGGNNLSGLQVVTFVENHDTGKEHDKWLWRDWDMAYAYILFAEGRPTIFYPHFYGIPQHDHSDPGITVQAPASLRQDIIRLINLRRNYLGGTMVVLSEVGNPWPSAEVADVFVARRGGNGTRSGAILVLNDHETDTKGLWVDSSPTGWPNWAGKDLINPETGETTHIYDDGRVYVWAPPRDYAIWVLQEEYDAGLLAADTGEPCTLAQIASQTVSGNQGVATFYSPDGIRELQFTLLDNLTVVSVQGAGGERFSPVEGGRYTLDDGQEPPVYVEVVFQQVDPAVSHGTYYAVVGSMCPYEEDGLLEANLDPSLRFENRPQHFRWEGPAPNPFVGQTYFELALPEAAQVRLTVYDLLGRAVQQLTSGAFAAGHHRIAWNADGLAGGTYLVRMEARTADGQHYVQDRVVTLRR
ncbi:hypothetical protein RmaAA213_00600 [Rhodothermus marinus]|nr:hypothetical protein RmaAA213_00600 [Rhodothermus marinus]